jgi:hypothetical protein
MKVFTIEETMLKGTTAFCRSPGCADNHGLKNHKVKTSEAMLMTITGTKMISTEYASTK